MFHAHDGGVGVVTGLTETCKMVGFPAFTLGKQCPAGTGRKLAFKILQGGLGLQKMAMFL